MTRIRNTNKEFLKGIAVTIVNRFKWRNKIYQKPKSCWRVFHHKPYALWYSMLIASLESSTKARSIDLLNNTVEYGMGARSGAYRAALDFPQTSATHRTFPSFVITFSKSPRYRVTALPGHPGIGFLAWVRWTRATYLSEKGSTLTRQPSHCICLHFIRTSSSLNSFTHHVRCPPFFCFDTEANYMAVGATGSCNRPWYRGSPSIILSQDGLTLISSLSPHCTLCSQ